MGGLAPSHAALASGFVLASLSLISSASAQVGTNSSVGMEFPVVFALFGIFFIIVVVVIAARAANAFGGGSRIQRPAGASTAYPPPPPPDTVLVKCQFCGTSQPFKDKCSNCGAPLPKPGFT